MIIYFFFPDNIHTTEVFYSDCNAIYICERKGQVEGLFESFENFIIDSFCKRRR